MARADGVFRRAYFRPPPPPQNVSLRALTLAGAAAGVVWNNATAWGDSYTLTNSSATAQRSSTGNYYAGILGSTSHSSGKWLLKFTVDLAGSGSAYFGLGTTSWTATWLGGDGEGLGLAHGSGEISIGSQGQSPFYTLPAAPSNGSVRVMAFDLDAGRFWIHNGSTWFPGAPDSVAGMDMDGSPSGTLIGKTWYPAYGSEAAETDSKVTLDGSNSGITATVSMPSGFTAWDGAGSTDITGTLAATESGMDDTASITGAEEFTGTLSATESGMDDTASISGTIEAIGSLDATESGMDDTAAITGAEEMTGTLSATESAMDDTADITGTIEAIGSLAATESGMDDTADITGTVETNDVTGTLAATESGMDDTSSITGAEDFTGTLSATEDQAADTADITGVIAATGTLSATESGMDDTASMTGAEDMTGTLSATEAGMDDTASITGDITTDATGTLAATETSADTASIAGTVDNPVEPEAPRPPGGGGNPAKKKKSYAGPAHQAGNRTREGLPAAYDRIRQDPANTLVEPKQSSDHASMIGPLHDPESLTQQGARDETSNAWDLLAAVSVPPPEVPPVPGGIIIKTVLEAKQARLDREAAERAELDREAERTRAFRAQAEAAAAAAAAYRAEQDDLESLLIVLAQVL